MKALLKDFLHLVYPCLCVGCHQEPVNDHEIFCISCEAKLPITDFHLISNNEALSRLGGGFPFQLGISMFRFYPGGIVQSMIHEIKYKGQTNIALRLGRKYGQLLIESGKLSNVDWLVPVPLHPVKLRQRGYNQSKFFADGLSMTLQKPVLANVIRRTEHTETQTAKNRYERLKNMMSAFELDKNSKSLEGKHILLVDDVLTTGATLESCALALSKIAGIEVSFATIAIAQ